MTQSNLLQFFATAAKGTEPALRDELRSFRIREVRADRGGVHFSGTLPDAFRVCLKSHIAMRVLWHQATFEALHAHDLYEGTRQVRWIDHLSARHTLAVRVTGTSPALNNTQFTAQKIKDAIVDQMRSATGVRSSVDREDPDVLVFANVHRNQISLYLDVGGLALFQRGWRKEAGDAPLKETLAGAILRFCDVQSEKYKLVVDPMCGSGTLLIEAFLMKAKMAPGLLHTRFGLERWASTSADLQKELHAIREEIKAQVVDPAAIFRGSDLDSDVIFHARNNARLAGTSIDFSVRDVRQFVWPNEPTLLITNPPYGERLTEGTRAFHYAMAKRFAPLRKHTLGVLSGSPTIERSLCEVLERRPDASWNIMNGQLECQFLLFRPRV